MGYTSSLRTRSTSPKKETQTQNWWAIRKTQQSPNEENNNRNKITNSNSYDTGKCFYYFHHYRQHFCYYHEFPSQHPYGWSSYLRETFNPSIGVTGGFVHCLVHKCKIHRTRVQQ